MTPMLMVRAVVDADAEPLSELLNAVIAQGGTTALEDPFTAHRLAEAYLTGPAVMCCYVALAADGSHAGFQTLGRLPTLPPGIGDIGTFARVGAVRRGVGSALFAATVARARSLGLTAINATIRADNAGGLVFYTRCGFVDHAVVEPAPLRDGRHVARVVKRFAL